MSVGRWTARARTGETSSGSPLAARLRSTMVILALLTSAAHLYAIPGATPEVTFWLETEVVGYLLIAVVYLLGLRSWYRFAIGYSVFNMAIFFLSAITVMPGVTHANLLGHLQFADYSFGRAFSLAGWVYLIAVGVLLRRIDPGSSVDALLRQSLGAARRTPPAGTAGPARAGAVTGSSALVRATDTAQTAVSVWSGPGPLSGAGAGMILAGATATLTVVGAGIGMLFMAAGALLLVGEGARRIVARCLATRPGQG